MDNTLFKEIYDNLDNLVFATATMDEENAMLVRTAVANILDATEEIERIVDVKANAHEIIREACCDAIRKMRVVCGVPCLDYTYPTEEE